MSSLSRLPTAANDYHVDLTTRITQEVWNATVGDMAKRMRVLEEIKVSFAAIEAAGISAALKRIDIVIGPAIDQVNVILSVAEEKAEQIAALLAQLQGTGLPAVNITLAPIPGLSAQTVQAGMAELAGQVSQRPTRGESLALAIALG